MFGWLIGEMARIKTPKFHLVDGPASDELRQAVEASDFPLPPSYKEFVLRFGNAKLYRYSTNYYVTVFAGPREAESAKGEAFIQFGRTWTSLAYFKKSLLIPGSESPVFEWRHRQGVRPTASGFEEWLAKKCRAARRQFTKKEWAGILKGPAPFTDEEKAIVGARRQFRWRVLGVADNGDLQFEVHNGSSMFLPYLSLGVRRKGGDPFGVIWLPVGHLAPSETGIVEKDCYKDIVDPNDIEVFDEPDPGPEDRDCYWEFQAAK